jgi:hypothetical protein
MHGKSILGKINADSNNVLSHPLLSGLMRLTTHRGS